MCKKLLSLLLLVMLSLPVMAQMATPDETLVFKKTATRDLNLHVFYPNDKKKGKNRPVVISFFGGGWTGGNPNQFYMQSEFYASLGFVAISAEYRVAKTDKTTPFEAVMDAKSAVRWVRENKKLLGIDPQKVITSGGSAGGHVAACTAIIEGVDDESDNMKISAVPDAMVLFNPVVNTTKKGYGANKLKGQETTLSPVHHVRENLPPTLVMHGTNDKTVPYKNAVDFTKAMKAKGNNCTLISAFGEGHGAFNSPEFRSSCGDRNYKRSLHYTAQFFADLGYISKDKVPQKEVLRIACLGNSITFGSRIKNPEKDSYPAVLQTLLGEDYEVKNFGLSGATLLSTGNKPYIKSTQYKELKAYMPDVVIVKMGTNDSKMVNWEKGETFVADYQNLIKSLKPKKGRQPSFIICSPVPAFTDAQSESINGVRILDEVIPKVKEVAKKGKLLYIDLHTPFVEDAALFPDKVHPSAEGAKKMATIIYNAIAQESVPVK